MKGRLRGLALLAASIAGFLAAPGSAAERVTYADVKSAALGRTLPVAVVSPAGPSRADVSVLFFLHGRGRHHRSLIDEPDARAALLTAPWYIVLPQGEDGWYLDSPVREHDRYAPYLAEVVAWAERTLPVARDAGRRGIVGWSMGGYGAVRFAQLHPGQFGFVGSVIGLLDFPRAETQPAGQNYRVPVDRFTADPTVWATLNPLYALDGLRGSTITLVLATRGFELTMNETFITAMNSAGLPAPRVHRLEGGHEFPLVVRALPLVLADAAARFDRAAAVSIP